MKLSDQITRRHLFVAFGSSAQTGSLSSVDLAATRDDVSVALTASDGSVAPIAGADASSAGVMTAADKVKLDNLPPTTARDLRAFSDVGGTGIGAAITHLRTAGHSSPGDGGGGLYRRSATQPAHPGAVQSGDGAWWELVPGLAGLDPHQLGARGDGVTDDAAALAGWLGAGTLTGNLTLSPGTYLTGTALVATDNPHRIIGAGWQRAADNSFLGTVLKASAPTVTNLLTVQSTSPSSQGTTHIQGIRLADFVLVHRGAGAAIRLDNVYRAFLENLYIECNNDEGARGIELANDAFFATIFKCVVREFADIGIVIDGPGTQHIIRECHVSATNETASAGVEIRRRDFLVDGGQYNVNRTDNAGVGIRVYNTEASIQQGGRIRNILSEADVAVEIDGDTKPFSDVIVETPHFNLNQVSKGVVFKRALRCILDRPSVRNLTSGGVLCEWGANSDGCGLICDASAASAPIIVNASAVRAWKHVYGRITEAERDAITTDPNLITTCEWVEGIGPCLHNGTAWDVTRATIANDAAASFTPPTPNGYVEVMVNADLDYYWLGGHSMASTQAYAAGADTNNMTSNGPLTGTSGIAGKVTVRMNSADGKFYVENRSGGSKTFWVRFKRPVL